GQSMPRLSPRQTGRATGDDRRAGTFRWRGSIEAVERRLADFRERTLPLLDHYRRRGVPLTALPVTAAMTAGEMCEILTAIMMKDRKGVRP
ncbi:MAG: hypothetical protein HGA24_03505, partial [Candidatus Aminicenantes bacterium]|nr:hypothetical protein [Candidatus Aminicenantes bacterium]